jgi:hypothetical protein
LDSKLLLTSASTPGPDSHAAASKDKTTDAGDISPTACPMTGHEDEPIRPFVYRAPTGKEPSSDPSHPKRRSSDLEHRGN